MIRTARRPTVRLDHPRRPEPSRAFLWATLDGKREDIVEVAMTVDELVDLAQEALNAAVTLRRVNQEAVR